MRQAPWPVVAGGAVIAAAATLVLPGGPIPGVWDILVALSPQWSLPALALAIVGTIGAVAWIAARGIGAREHPVAVALSAALAAFLLAPAPLDPSPLPFALLGLLHLTGRRRSSSHLASNDNAAPIFSWVARPVVHDSIHSIRREG